MIPRLMPWKTWGVQLSDAAGEFRALPGTTETEHGIRIDWSDPKAQEIYNRLMKRPEPVQGKRLNVAGPGTELTLIFDAMGIKPDGCSGRCTARQMQMNAWGVAGCRDNFDTIVGWMREAYNTLTIMEKCRAAKNALISGIALKLIKGLDPIPSLVDEAIARAQQKQPAEACSSKPAQTAVEG